MKRFFSVLVAIVCLSIGGALFAAESILTFKSSVDEKRYQSLIEELRCPKCQNQNLADSEASISGDLRTQVYDMVDQGISDKEILDYMVARYGEFVLYRPQNTTSNFLLWYGPFILLAVGLLAFVAVIIKNRNTMKNKAQSND